MLVGLRDVDLCDDDLMLILIFDFAQISLLLILYFAFIDFIMLYVWFY